MDYDKEIDDLLDALEDLGFDVPATCSPIAAATKCIDELADALDWACAAAAETDADSYDRADHTTTRHPTDACRWLALRVNSYRDMARHALVDYFRFLSEQRDRDKHES